MPATTPQQPIRNAEHEDTPTASEQNLAIASQKPPPKVIFLDARPEKTKPNPNPRQAQSSRRTRPIQTRYKQYTKTRKPPHIPTNPIWSISIRTNCYPQQTRTKQPPNPIPTLTTSIYSYKKLRMEIQVSTPPTPQPPVLPNNDDSWHTDNESVNYKTTYCTQHFVSWFGGM